MNEPKRKSGPWRKSAISVAGVIVIGIGIVMLVAPGPGLLVIAAGLAILATEFEWAERQLARVRRRLHELKERAKPRPK